jgi:hypothetical protein
MFEAVAEGEAQVKVPLNGALDPKTGKVKTLRTFSMTIRVGPARGNSRRQGSPLRLDQANSPPWSGAWITLDYLDGPGIPLPKWGFRVLSQTFVPRLAKLTSMEVQLAAAKPGQSTGEVGMLLMTKHQVLADVWKTTSCSFSRPVA